MANLTRQALWYRNLSQERKLQIREKTKERYRNATPEQLEKRRARNRRWYARHPENISHKNRRIYSRFAFARNHAKRSGRDWNISKSDFAELISKRCHYCDGALPESGCGLDRMDNTKGYLIGNVVPCCRGCNITKGDRLTYEEMVAAMKAVLLIRLRKVGVS